MLVCVVDVQSGVGRVDGVCDEGFGAGDARFFQKAQERMEKFIEAAGTLILASHSDALLRKFCRRGLVFNKGMIIFDGALEDSLAFYHDQQHV